MHRRRWPLAGPRGGRRPWPQPRRGDGRECIESASETAPALRGRPSAALAIRKSASELNLHLKRRRLTWVCASHTRARRRRRCSFLRIRLAALRWSSEQLRGHRRQLAGAAASQWVSDICSLPIPSRHIGGFIRWRVWRVGAEGRAGLFCVMHRRRWPLAGPRGGRRPWPQPRRGDGRECIESASETAPALRGRPSAALAIRKSACELSLHLKRRRLTWVCASHTRARRRRRCSFLRIRLAALRWSSEQLRGHRRQLAGAAASQWVSDICSLPIPSRHIGGFIRWRVWRVGAEGCAGLFCVMHRRRWPLAGPRGGRRPWPQPRRGDGRECIESASETAPALRGRPSAALAIRKSASELNLHLKRRRLTWVCASHTRARRRRRCSFLRIRLAALRWSSEQLRGHRRQLAGAAASQWVSDICSLPIPSRHIGGFIRWRVWRVGAEGCAGLFCVMHRRRWPLAGPRGGRRPWPQPRRGDGRECIESASETAPALRGRPSAALAIRKSACELNLHLKRRRLTWVCASHTRARRRRRCSFLRIRLAALRWSSEQLRGHRRQLAGAAASQWVSDICSLPIPSRHIGGFIRWRVWRVGAEGCAGLFCVMHRRRWPLAGPRGGRRPWPQPRRGDGRECIEFASETAPALRGRPSAALAIRKSACELNLHLKRRRLTWVCASHTRARRRRRCSFLRIRLAALRWSSEQLRGHRRQLAGAAASQWVSDICSLPIPSRHIGGFIRWRVWRVGAEGCAGLRQ